MPCLSPACCPHMGQGASDSLHAGLHSSVLPQTDAGRVSHHPHPQGATTPGSQLTGMFLEMDNDDLIHLLECPQALLSKIHQAVAVLRASQMNVSTTAGVCGVPGCCSTQQHISAKPWVATMQVCTTTFKPTFPLCYCRVPHSLPNCHPVLHKDFDDKINMIYFIYRQK